MALDTFIGRRSEKVRSTARSSCAGFSGTCCPQTDRCDDFAKQLNLNLRIISAYWVMGLRMRTVILGIVLLWAGQASAQPISPVSRSP